jgi:hypothetical protein
MFSNNVRFWSVSDAHSGCLVLAEKGTSAFELMRAIADFQR